MEVSALTPLAAAVLEVPVPERALVVGCGDGDGEAVLFLAREFPVARIRGVDPSKALVRAAAARVGLDPEGRVAFKPGRPGALPYPDDHFDLVVQLDGRPSPAEIVRVLRPEAHLILIDSGQPGFAAGARRTLRGRRLARRGLELGQAGDGNFFVGRLSPGG